MHTAELLRDVVVLLAASLPIVAIFQRIKVPALVGFLVAGMLIGPTATGLIRSTETVDALAEIGVVLLLFAIGLDVSLEQLSRVRRVVLGAGSVQVLATIAAVTGLCTLCGYALPEAVVLGFVVALSSTVIVLKVLNDRGELDSPHGQIALGVLLFQDFSVLPMLLLLPLLSAPDRISVAGIALVLGQALLVIAAVFTGARFVLPTVLHQVLRLRNRELLVGVVVLLCFGTAWVTAQLGVSLAIGAFIAGLVIAESEYSHQVVAEILPVRDLLNSVFFISIGMLLDLPFLLGHVPLLVGLAVGAIALKAVLGGLAVLPFQPAARVAVAVGIILAQVGEFSFVLGREAAALGTLSAAAFQIFLDVSVLTMLVSPFLVAAAPRLALWLFSGREEPLPAVGPALTAHVVIIGYGLNGQNLSRVLRATGLAYRILDLNAESVRRAAAAGEPIAFGDATRAVVLGHVQAATAAVIVVAISDPVATRHIVSVAREVNPNAALIVRTRYVNEIEELYRLGADEVIPEEFETSVEIFARVLQRMSVPPNVIDLQIDLIRGERYAALRGLALPAGGFDDLSAVLAASTTETYLLLSGSPAIGASLRALDLRHETGVTVIAVVRHGHAIGNPPPEFELAAGDVLVMLGAHAELAAARRRLAPAGRG